MPFTVGQSGVANYANTTLTTVTRVVADGGMGGSGESAVGGSSRVDKTYTISANAMNLTVYVDSLSGYVAGKTDITIIVDAGIYVWSPTEGSAALNIGRASTGDTVKLVNNCYIVGWGGNGAGLGDYGVGFCCCSGVPFYQAGVTSPSDGTLALNYSSLTSTVALTVENNGYIAGGGGGGGGAIVDDTTTAYFFDPYGGALGGGGSGGGISYSTPAIASNNTRATPTSPTGLNGGFINEGILNTKQVSFYRGGGGGFTFPGVGGALGSINSGAASEGIGGGSGGSGAAFNFTLTPFTPSNPGGTANEVAQNPSSSPYSSYVAGGGGGWGANGANGYKFSSLYQAGAAGGPAIKRNGSTINITVGLTRIYGTRIN